MNTKLDFINGNTKKCLLAMTLPMIVAMFLNMAYNLVDSLWIGNLLGELAYAALTNSTPIVLLLTSVAMGATNGISILLSQAIGARNEQKKKKEEEVVAKEKEAAELQAKYFGPQGELYKKRQSLMEPIQNDIYEAIKKLSEEKGYQAIFDRASSAGIIFASPRIDVSNDVLAKLGYSK